MCHHHATCVPFECTPLVTPIPAKTQIALQISPLKLCPLCVWMHSNYVSVGVHQEAMSHKQCQQSPHTFDKMRLLAVILGCSPF